MEGNVFKGVRNGERPPSASSKQMTDHPYKWQLPFLPEKYTVRVKGQAIEFKLISHIHLVADDESRIGRLEDQCTYRCEKCGSVMPGFLREARQAPLREDVLHAMELHASEEHGH